MDGHKKKCCLYHNNSPIIACAKFCYDSFIMIWENADPYLDYPPSSVKHSLMHAQSALMLWWELFALMIEYTWVYHIPCLTLGAMLGDGNETQATDVKNNGRWNYNNIYYFFYIDTETWFYQPKNLSDIVENIGEYFPENYCLTNIKNSLITNNNASLISATLERV